MAANLLPILLLGGAAALVMGKKKKKSASKCPAEVAIAELTEDQTTELAKKAWADANGDPIRAADLAFARLVPAGCTKKDYKTKVTWKQLSEFKSIDWNLSSFYAALVSSAMEYNIDVTNEEDLAQGKAVMERVSTWYSQLTGEPLPDID